MCLSVCSDSDSINYSLSIRDNFVTFLPTWLILGSCLCVVIACLRLALVLSFDFVVFWLSHVHSSKVDKNEKEEEE
jgi:hypothetical protein